MRWWLFPVLMVIPVFAAAAGGEDKDLEKTVTAQVMLDLALFSPGEIDGVWGDNGKKALRAFQEAHDLEPTGRLTDETSSTLARVSRATETLTRYTITASDVDGPYLTTVPEEMGKLPPLPHLGYTTITEMLGERFHADPELLKKLNPDARWEAGEEVRVPAVASTLIRTRPEDQEAVRAGKEPESDEGTSETERARASWLPADLKSTSEGTVVVSKGGGHLRLLDKGGKVRFFAPVTTGSEHDPLPLGEWKINGTERYPEYSYNPELIRTSKPGDKKAKIRPGPNNPVGVAWIDITREHYGLHGTREPGKIGYTESNGCVRLTNWDALRLADMVRPGTKVIFEE